MRITIVNGRTYFRRWSGNPNAAECGSTGACGCAVGHRANTGTAQWERADREWAEIDWVAATYAVLLCAGDTYGMSTSEPVGR